MATLLTLAAATAVKAAPLKKFRLFIELGVLDSVVDMAFGALLWEVMI